MGLINNLFGIIPTNNGLSTFGNPERTTDGDYNNPAQFWEVNNTTGKATWDIGSIIKIKSVRANFAGTQLSVVRTQSLYYSTDNATWTQIWIYSIDNSTDRTDVLDVNVRYFKYELVGDGVTPALSQIYEIQAYFNRNELITTDTTDEYSLPVHNSWGVQAGLPLPQALRAWK